MTVRQVMYRPQKAETMDYLDPKKKKNHKIRLMFGYALLGIAISFATVTFVYLANGFYLDRETGEVIQNGLIFVDSKPESAAVHINGEQQNNGTDARLVLPEGAYSIELTRDGYHTWNRSLNLEGGKLRRLTYARLIPQEVETGLGLSLPTIPSTVSQSNDKRWIVLATDNNTLQMQYVDLNRTSLLLEELRLPVGLMQSEGPGVWDIVEWADDQRTFLAEYRTESGTEYVLIDRADPAQSKNVSVIFAAQPFTDVSMRDRKNDLLFLHDAVTGSLYRANATSGEIELFVEGAIDYVVHGSDAVLYVTTKNATEGMVKAVLKRGSEEYPLRDILVSDIYLLELAKLGNALVMGVGSPAENRVIVYNDPINAIQNNEFSTLPVPTTVLRVANPEELSISSDSSVITARGAQKFGSHEFEEDRTYVFEVESPINGAQELQWVDGQHFVIGVDTGSQLISDFEGSNQHILTESTPALGSIFDGPIDHQYTFLPALQPELPESLPRMQRTFMRTAADR